MTKETILQFIKSRSYAVISTCGSSNRPEAALIGFAATDSLELIFGTYKTSRKYKNIQENNRVAAVIGWDEDYITVQYEGMATELHGEERARLANAYHAQVPGSEIYKSHPDQTYFKITPTWIRYAAGKQEEIVELSLEK